MNVNSSNSKSLSQCEVRSKYFTENPVMDESSDFQEKKNFTAPKKTEKAGTKTNPKKAIKRIKGQKDIRSALKSKKNELVAFSNDFDKICKQSGIDVDPEQLQLAIALSKSLQQSEEALESSGSHSSGSLTSQERTGKIRTTLLEYGFKVPEIKITAAKGRKLKRHRKNYKLLLASESEKQQVISDRYSQILFQNINSITKTINANETSETKVPLYHIATNTCYVVLKSNNKFYVKDLIEINQVSAGGLLRNWSDIPGRPATPQLELPDINFSDIDCSQEELDTILAGTLESAQDLVKEKYKLIEKEVKLQSPKVNFDTHCDIDLKMDATVDISHKTSNLSNKTAKIRCIEGVNNPVIIIDSESPQALSVTSQVRSCSPDIFEDEVSSILDVSKENTEALYQEKLCKEVTKHKSDFMDLTECVNITSQKDLHINNTTFKIGSRMLSQLSQEENKTKRKSNDFMEMTECVSTSSQPAAKKAIEKVDLTQNLIQCYSTSIVSTKTLKDDAIESMDLTQSSSSSNDSLPFVQISVKDKNFDDTIILTEDAYYVGRSNDLKSEIIGNNIGPEGHTNDVLLQNSVNHDDEDKSLVLVDTESDGESNIYKGNDKHNKSDNQRHQEEITSANAISDISPVHQSVSKSESFFEEFDHPHSESSKEHAEDDIVCINDPQDNPVTTECFSNHSMNDKVINDIDLTQSSGSSIKSDSTNMNKTNKENNLGTKNLLNYDIPLNDGNDNCDVSDHDEKNTNDIDLTQSSGSSIGNRKEIKKKKEINKTKETLDDEISVIENHDKTNLNDSLNNDNCISNDIDLTQTSDSSTEQVEFSNSNVTAKDNSAATKVSDTNSLGKVGDISIDYDEIFDDMIASHTNQSNSYKSESNEITETNDSTEKLTKESTSVSNCSQNSDIFEICDDELNYSMNRSRHEIINRHFDIGGLSIMDDLSKASGSKLSTDFPNVTNNACVSVNETFLPEVNLGGTRNDKINNIVKSKATPFRNVLNEDKNLTKTPANNDYIIKTDHVTPMLDYESLTTPERNRELDKYGLKPFKRKRAIQLLSHIYNQTHPIVESCSEDLPSPSKKQKKDNDIPNTKTHISPKKIVKSPAKSNAKSPRKKCEVQDTANKDILEEIDKENEDIYRITNEVPEIKNIECSEEDWVFPKREKAKVHSCRLPLHVALHNFVSCRRGLRAAILRYEPVSIDVIHRGLVNSGHKYDAKELLKFMDKKCITVKTADNNTKANRKHY